MTADIASRVFEPGTSGWTVDDLYGDPEIFSRWSKGRHELVEGVLTKTSLQGYEAIDPLSNLRRYLQRHLDEVGQDAQFCHEVDLLLGPDRIPRPDLIVLTAEQRFRQKRMQRERTTPCRKSHPVLVTPILVVESVSWNHQAHDRLTKRGWYAEAGIPHYWILTEFERSLVCLTLDGNQYKEEAIGHNNEIIKSSIFGGIQILLSEVWDDDE